MKRLLTLALLAAMAGFGWIVYTSLGAHRSNAVIAGAQAPNQTRPKLNLPGTIVLAQAGALYRLQSGVFTEIATGGWTQPAANPAHNQLVAVKRTDTVSDLYLLDTNGHPVRQLTEDGSRTTQLNHWAFYPRFSADGQTVFYSWDPKDPGNAYRVDLSVYSLPVARGQPQARRWTTPNFYTGGDVNPVPLPSGALLYTKYDIDAAGQIFAQIWLAPKLGAVGKALTQPADNCSQAALAPDGTQLAMTCSSAQTTRLEMAPFDGATLGAASVLVDGLVADPSWAPDGKSLLYFAPEAPSGHFQLFWLKVPPRPTPTPPPVPGAAGRPARTDTAQAPAAPVQITTNNDFDTTSFPVWWQQAP